MDWLILILGVPAILIPLVLLFGFAGCAQFARECTSDVDCPAGTRCVDGACVDAALNPLPPENLAAIALDDRSVSLTWTNVDPAATDFQIERAEDGEDFDAIAPEDLEDVSSTGATDVSDDLQEGVTYIYQVRALLGQEASLPSDTSSATVFPAAPVLAARATSFDQIDLSWNDSAGATEFSLEHREPGDAFAEIFRGVGTTFSHSGLVEGTRHEYRVFAIVDGFQDEVAQDVKSAASPIVSETTLAFTEAFTAPGTLATDAAGLEGFCLVQRLSQPFLAGGTQVRILLRGSTTGSLTLDRVTISQPAATGDLYDAAPDLTEVASGVIIPPDATVTVGPVNYTLDPTQDLLVAADISNTPGEGNLSFGTLTGADAFGSAATAEAGVQDRTTGYPNVALDRLHVVEKIEVL
jgi:hypothetical protein